MVLKVNKQLILEDYMQDMIDGMDSDDAVNKWGVPVEDETKYEHEKDKFIKPQSTDKPGSFLKSKYYLYDDPDNISYRMLDQIAHKHNVPFSKGIENSHEYMKELGHMENDYLPHGGNNVKDSTIKGLYQVSNDQLHTDKTRFTKYFTLDDEAPYMDRKTGLNVDQMDDKQQTVATIAGLSQHPNSNSNGLHRFSKMMNGDTKAGYDMYIHDHHTDPSHKPMMARAEKIMKNIKLKS